MKYNKNKYFDKGGYGNKKKNETEKPHKKNESPEIIYYYPDENLYFSNVGEFPVEHYPPEFHPEHYPPEFHPEQPYLNPPNYFPEDSNNFLENPQMLVHPPYNHPPHYYPPHPNERFFPEDFYHNDKKQKKELGRKIIQSNKKTLKENRTQSEYKRKIESLSDLIELSKNVENDCYTNISLNQEHLLNLQEPLIKLQNLIGMESIKQNIFNQLIFFLQNIEPQFPHMLHTCIEGPPGCGKTELANILALIYANLGIIQESKVVVARRSDLVAGFLGQTAQKTQDLIDSAKGGVLLIDEAYSLGNEDKKDSFAKECIDTLNQNLTEGKGDFICIIAGYKEDLEKSFFGFNSGLERRFPYRFSIDEYDATQLYQIYQFILQKNDWNVNKNNEKEIIEFLRENRENFKFNGGDLENLVHFSKLAYAKNRVFTSGEKNKVIQFQDLKNAYEMYISNKKKELIMKTKEPPSHMYS